MVRPEKKKMFISRQAGQNFPPVWDGFPDVFLYYFPSKSQNFLARSFPFCLFLPGLATVFL